MSDNMSEYERLEKQIRRMKSLARTAFSLGHIDTSHSLLNDTIPLIIKQEEIKKGN